MKLRSAFFLAALLSFVCQQPFVAHAETDKEALIGQPVLYKGELIGGSGEAAGKASTARAAIPGGLFSTTLPGPGSTLPLASSTTVPDSCGAAPESGDPTNLLFPLDGSFVPVPFFSDGGSGHRPATAGAENNDDDSYLISNLPFDFDFCGTETNTIAINNNGNLTLTDRFSPFTPTGFPIPVSTSKVPMLAPFWADVDSGDEICPAGDVWMKQTDNTLIVTWDNVGYYEFGADRRNTFQIAISDGTNPEMGLGNTICLSYDEMEWTSGDASGGTGGLNGAPANVGGSFGDGVGFFQIGEFDNDTDSPEYDGPFMTTDNVNFLDGFRTCFCLCDPAGDGGNVPPIPLFKAPEDCSVTVDTTFSEAVDLDLLFISPEEDQVTTVSLRADDGTDARGLSFGNTQGNPAVATIDWTPVIADEGTYNLILRAEDDYFPIGVKDVPCDLTVITTCGNGTTAGNEQCDDGNRTAGDGCDANCIIEFCGDSITNNTDEECDDGNTANGDGCDDDCDLEVCGNGETQFGEECDDGNTADGDSCNADCTINICPDGVQFVGVEECDDGNTNDGDNCTNVCTIAECGDNSLQIGVEECDDGNTADGDGCDSTCDLEVCGNGETQFGEECDDGNTADGDGCDSTCDLEICGNGETQFGEECDDGNTANGDGCDDDCDLEVCGNGETQFGEECDDGNTADGDSCNADCTINVCGDEVVFIGVEECDDANTNDNDACKNDCTFNICPDGFVYTGVENCDDGNTVDTDACLSDCTEASCGDGFVYLCVKPDPNATLNTDGADDAEEISIDTRVKIANDKRGTYIAVWQSKETGADWEIEYAVSTDNAATFSAPAPLNNNAGMDGAANDERPSIATDGDGTWVTVWHTNYNNGSVGTDADIAFAVSTDDGATWTNPAFLNSNAAGTPVLDKFPFIFTDGSIFVVTWQTQQFGGDNDLAYSVSSDGGATWSTAAPLNTSALTDSGTDNAADLSVAPDGTWIAVWQSKETFGVYASDFDIFMATTADPTAGWSAPVPVNSNAIGTPVMDDFASIAHVSGTNWVVAWRSQNSLGNTIGADNDIVYATSSDHGATWSDPVALDSNAFVDAGSEGAVRLEADDLGALRAVWQTEFFTGAGGTADIVGAASNNNGVTWTSTYAVNSVVGTSVWGHFFPQIISDNNGSFLTVWQTRDPEPGGAAAGLETDYDLLLAQISCEACEPADQEDPDCREDCTARFCGDAILDSDRGEDCDDGNTDQTDDCLNTCEDASCGDGFLWDGVEECDDGNTTDGDGCDSTCDLEVCGNGETQFGEECDDGNTADGDGCDSTCDLEVCGNGETQSGEECDDGNTAIGDGCDEACVIEVCGNGKTQSGEECDDGNTANGDGCDSTCVIEICGNGISQAGEECDDGNSNDNDSCKNDCTENVCGDGVIETDVEDCDPGTDVPGDCCDATCLYEAVSTVCSDFDDPGADPECNAGACNASGVCEPVTANEGGACTPDMPDQCVKSYACEAGSCVEDELFLTGHACDWLVVGGGDAGGRVLIVDSSVNTGDICVEFGLVGTTRVDGSVVSNSSADEALRFRQDAFVLNDIISGGGSVKGADGVDLPGLPPGTNTVAGDTIVSKNPTGVYNTFGLGIMQDPRVEECGLAQSDVANSNINVEALSSDADNGDAAGTLLNVNAPNCGGVNVVDYDTIDMANYATINLAGNCVDNTSTVLVIRVGVLRGTGRFDTNLQSEWNLNGLDPGNILIYATGSRCEIGENNTGGGAIMCPNGSPVQIKQGSIWDGQALGGDRKVQIGDSVTFTFVPFTGL